MHGFLHGAGSGPWTSKVVAREIVLPSLQHPGWPEPHSWTSINPGTGCGGAGCSPGGRIFDYIILTLWFLPVDEKPGHAW